MSEAEIEAAVAAIRSMYKAEIERLRGKIARQRAALLVADEAINPPDRSGISMETWNKRLKFATATIRTALGKP